MPAPALGVIVKKTHWPAPLTFLKFCVSRRSILSDETCDCPLEMQSSSPRDRRRVRNKAGQAPDGMSEFSLIGLTASLPRMLLVLFLAAGQNYTLSCPGERIVSPKDLGNFQVDCHTTNSIRCIIK